jgi:hypothetical protein
LFYALAETFKKNPVVWEKLIKSGDKFVDFTKTIQKTIEQGLKRLGKMGDDLFSD